MKSRSLPVTLTLILTVLILIACSKDPIKIACIGNSITYESGIEDRVNNSYPAQLQEILGANYDV